ncbi:hypothetical protein BJY52DRAFT_1297115 [Lactarius psammicola]|nr:hypothetical protein BJY52DRAFT_1297115 [Lactarius psammicola]
MLFYKPLVSSVFAMALASGVAASATPVRRAGPTPVTPWQCTESVNNLTCCDSSIIPPATDPLAILLIPLNQDPDLLVGLNCAITGTVAWYCTPPLSYSIRWLTHRSLTQQSLCCDRITNERQCLSFLWPSVLADELIIRGPCQRRPQLRAHHRVKVFSPKAVVQVVAGVSQRVEEAERVAECGFWCFPWAKY